MEYTNLLAHYDIIIDNYELRQQNGIVKTISLLVDNETVYTDVILNGKCLTENKALTMFNEIVGDDFGKVKIVSKNETARKKRHLRRKEYDYCPALFAMIKLINEEEEEENNRYDNKINSELLPNYTLSLWDVLDGCSSRIA